MRLITKISHRKPTVKLPHQSVLTLAVRETPTVVTPSEFVHVAVKVLAAQVVVCTLHAPLEQTPERFDALNMHVTVCHILKRVVNDFVWSEIEPPRESWRLQTLRGWSHDKSGQVSPRGTRAGGAYGAGAPARLPISMGGDLIDRC